MYKSFGSKGTISEVLNLLVASVLVSWLVLR